jgi:hypothetical protein
MDNAHFTLHGTLMKNRTFYYPITGNGVLQLRPVEALATSIYPQNYGSHATKIQRVSIGGRLYTRNGTGRWTSAPTPVSLTAITSYVGEEIINGTAVWHARTEAGRTTYDLWLRESDGYIVQVKYAGVGGTYTMIFDSYNNSPEIAAPKN